MQQQIQLILDLTLQKIDLRLLLRRGIAGVLLQRHQLNTGIVNLPDQECAPAAHFVVCGRIPRVRREYAGNTSRIVFLNEPLKQPA